MLNNRLSLLALFAPSILAQANLGPTSLINSFETPQDLKMLSASSATFTQVTQDATNGQYALQVNYQVASFPSINFLSQLGGLPPWNWSGLGGLAFDVCNPSGQTLNLYVVMTDATPFNGADKSDVADWGAALDANSCGTMLTLFQNPPPPLSMGMQAAPPVPGYIVMQYDDGTVDFSHIYQFEFYLKSPPAPVTLLFDNVRVFSANVSSLLYTGIVDSFGQYTQESWPGKVSSDNDLTEEAQLESEQAVAMPGSADQYGGNLGFPAVEATGFFRTTQDAAGRWWLVTPLGHLFFSIGMDEVPRLTTAQVATGTLTTDTQGRQQMFTSLPASGDPLAAFDTPAGSWPPPAGLGIQFSLGSGFDFYSANLYRKYGANYQASWSQSTIDRFTRWGVNEIGSFSDPASYSATGSLGQKIPHVVTLSYSSCAGCGNFAYVTTSQDYWGPMVDPFDPAFAAAADSAFAQQIPAYVSDSYLIGYFCDNELSWAGGVNDPTDSNHFSLVYGVLNSGAGQPAKQALVQMLTNEYSNIAALNQSWQSSFASWSDLLASAYNAPAPLPTASMRADFSAFLLSYAQKYFSVIGSTIKKYDSHHLYLGAKFSAFAIEEWQACAQLCDVVSFDDYNYRLDPTTWAFMSQFQKPAILAEFGFGSTDRGAFSGGLAPVSSQNARALSYGLKMQDAATNPNLLGATWYMYVDEPITGRLSDGENDNWGFVAVTDTPYPELSSAATVVNSVIGTWRALPGGAQAAAPQLSTISPSSVVVGSADVLLTVTGSGFAITSVVQWNGFGLQTLYISGTQLWALVPAGYLMSAARVAVTVSTPAPGGGASSAVAFTAGDPPLITGVGNAAGGQPGVVSGGFVSIYGSNFTPVSYDDWTNSITNGNLPTQLEGVSVTIGGNAAFVNAVTPGQLNVQAPDLSAGPVQVVVTNPNGASPAFTTTAAVYSPAFFPWPANQPVATHLDYSLAAKNGTISGLSTVPAKPGEVIILWGTGFGPTNPAVSAGQVPTVQAPATQATVSLTLGTATASVIGAVLSSYPATYQIAIQIPAVIADGDYPVVATVNGVGSPPNMLLTVQE